MVASRLRTSALLLVLVAPQGARAADDPAAQALFDEGRTLMQKREFARACPKLEESYRLSPALGARFQLAECLEQLGKTASAWAHFGGVSSAARTSGQSAREAAARERAQKLEGRLTRLTLHVPRGHPPELSVRRNGETVREAQWGTPVPVDPGDYEIVSEVPGRAPRASRLRVSGEGAFVSLEVPIPEQAAACTPAPPPTKQAPEPSSVRPIAGWSLLGVGALGIAGGVFSWVLRQQALDRLGQLCDGQGGCPVEALNDIANGRLYSVLAVGSAGLGVVAAAGGALLLWGPGASKGAAQVSVAPMGPKGIAVRLTY